MYLIIRPRAPFDFEKNAEMHSRFKNSLPELYEDGIYMRVLHASNKPVLISIKLEMLRCYESQWKWLKETQGMGNFLDNMRRSCAELAGKAPRKGIEYAEGFRQHNHVGFSAEDGDPLSRALGDKVVRNR